MSSRFKIALAAFIGLACTVAVVAVLLGVFDSKTESDTGLLDEEGRTVADNPENGMRTDGTPEDGPGLEGTRDGTTSGGTVTPGLRDPHGPDYSTEEARREHMLAIVGKEPIDWAELIRVLGLHGQELPEEVRDLLLKSIRYGPRNYARKAFEAVQDGTMTADLLAFLDDPAIDARGRDAVLQALSIMPGASADDVALGLEARLSDDFAKDRVLIRSIAVRGGVEATRAILDYIRRMDEPGKMNAYLLQGLDLKKSPEAQELVAEALRRDDWTPAALRQVLSIARQQGITSLTPAVIALDKNGQDDKVRREAINTLSRIGGKEAVEYILKKAAEPGVYGEHAVTALNSLTRAGPEGEKLLLAELDSAADHPQPDNYRAALLRALGNVGAEGASEKIVSFIRDPSDGVKIAAIRALGRLGPKAEKHVPAIVDQWGTAGESVKVRIVITLGTIGGKDAVAAMEQMVTTEDLSKHVRRNLVMGLNAAKKRLDGPANPPPPAVGPGLGGRMGPQGGR